MPCFLTAASIALKACSIASSPITCILICILVFQYLSKNEKINESGICPYALKPGFLPGGGVAYASDIQANTGLPSNQNLMPPNLTRLIYRLSKSTRSLNSLVAFPVAVDE